MKSLKRVWLIHGFNVWDDGFSTIDKLRPVFTTLSSEDKVVKVWDFDYGWLGLLGVRFRNRKIAKVLAHHITDNDIMVGHSNGCTLIAEALEQGVIPCGVVFINPALNANWRPPDSLPWLIIYYNSNDWIVLFSAALFFHPWGSMGRYGMRHYKGSTRVYQFDTSAKRIRGAHSAFFRNVRYWGKHLVDLILTKKLLG